MEQITVSKNGRFSTIASALKHCEQFTQCTIFIESGVYFEKLKIVNSNIALIGEDKDNTIICFDDYALKIHKDNKEYNTFRTYTTLTLGDNITLKNFTIKNSAGHGSKVGQAVALSANSQNLLVDNCNLYAHQDTLFCSPLPLDLQARYEGFLSDDERVQPNQFYQVFNKCKIVGDIDFIFGCAQSVFKDCQIHSLNNSHGYIAAPSTEEFNELGMLFYNCDFTSDAPPNSVYLARPWRQFGKVGFVNCHFDAHIKQEGFSIWQGTDRHKNSRFSVLNCTKEGYPYVPQCDFCRSPNELEIKNQIEMLNAFLKKRKTTSFLKINPCC